jgi:hypothetical protein
MLHGVSYFNRINLFSSIPLYCVLHGILLIYVKGYVTLSLIQHRMHSHSISRISLQMQQKFDQKYSEDYKSNVASLKFTILSDGNSSDISFTVFWDVASHRFTE